jgi:D-aminoacyl-tRNA deacylase
VAEAIEARAGTFFLKVEEAARHFAVDTPAFKDTLVDHQFYYQDLRSSCRSVKHLSAEDLRTYVLPGGCEVSCGVRLQWHTGPGRRAKSNSGHFMRIVLQRVKSARVDVAGQTVGSIGSGLLILLGVTQTDREEDADYLADKVVQLRIFPDEAGRMNRSLLDARGALLVVSQFTLYGDCRKGRRPSFDHAAGAEQARALYEYFTERLRLSNVAVETGVFQAEMEVHLINDGPVTFLLDSKRGLTEHSSPGAK